MRWSQAQDLQGSSATTRSEDGARKSPPFEPGPASTLSLDFRTVREEISVVPSHPFVVLCDGGPGELVLAA